MTHYLIDTENVGQRYMHIIEQLESGDEVLFFFTDTNKTAGIPFSVMAAINSKGASVKAVHCHKGTNALDFQLGSYLGFAIAKDTKANYVICSNDGGYNSILNFWTDHDVSVSLDGSDPDKTSQPKATKKSVANPAATVTAVTGVLTAEIPPLQADCKEVCISMLCDLGISKGRADHITRIIFLTKGLPENERTARLQELFLKQFGKNNHANLLQQTRPVIERIFAAGPRPIVSSAKNTAAKPAAKLPIPVPAAKTLPKKACKKAYKSLLSAAGIKDKYVDSIAAFVYGSFGVAAAEREKQIKKKFLKQLGKKDHEELFLKAKPVIDRIFKNGPVPKNKN